MSGSSVAVNERPAPLSTPLPVNKMSFRNILKQHWPLYLMLLPALLFLIVLEFYPLWGISIAFVDYNPFKGVAGSEYVGLKNFQDVFSRPQTLQIIGNTIYIAVGKIILGQVAAVTFSLLLSEVRSSLYRRIVQTFATLPYFLSWVIIGGVLVSLLSSSGLFNDTLQMFGLSPIPFLRDNAVFPWTLITSDVWKGFGFGSVIYLAAITQVNPELYDAAAVDGAGRFRRMVHVTFPAIRPTIVLLALLSLGGVLNAGFDQILVLYNPLVYETGDVIDTYVYRAGLLGFNYEIATVVGLFKSVVGFILITLSYWMAGRFANYRVF